MSNLVDVAKHSTRIDIPLEFAAVGRYLGATNGNPSEHDVLAALAVYPWLSQRGRACRLQLASSAGSVDILLVSYQQSYVGARVHSTTEPVHDDLLLAIPNEKHDADVHIFTAVDMGDRALVHVIGWLSRSDDTWSQYRNDPLPASGFRIPAARLRSFESLVDILDES